MWPFKEKQRRSAVLIDISSSFVAGAYARYEEDELPTIYYSVRMPVETREHENATAAMLRTLDAVGMELIERGAPALRRETGSGHADGVLVTIGAPWQETKVHSVAIEPGKPFIVTSQLLNEAVILHTDVPDDRIGSGQLVIATILNGYDVPNPIGKTVNRAEVVILSSTLDKEVTESVRTRIRSLYHTHRITFAAFTPTAYSVLRNLYPHQKDFLMLSVSGEGTDLASVHNGLLSDIASLPAGTTSLFSFINKSERMTAIQPGYISPALEIESAQEKWSAGLVKLFKQFAEHHSLPRTLFLLADPSAYQYIKHVLESSNIRSLWRADESLSVICMTPEQFASRVRTRGLAQSDTFLSILALYQQKLL